MGCYINPGHCSKEEWLKENGDKLVNSPDVIDSVAGMLLVCLVDNGPFTAAAIAYSNEELREFARWDDFRPKEWYLVPLAKLLEVMPSLARYMNTGR